MENYIGKLCPVCNTEIKEGDAVKICPACNIVHHENCWAANKGCATFGCPEQNKEAAPAPAAAPVQPVYEAAAPAPAPQPAQPYYQNNQQWQGQPYNPNAQAMPDQFNGAMPPPMPPAKKKSKAPLIIGLSVAAIVVIIIIAIIAGASSGPDLEAIYREECSSVWATVGSDGQYLRIDTNPYDRDDDGVAYLDAYETIEVVNEKLGLPSSLFTEMGETRGMDGVQSRTFSDQGVSVTWKYHPDTGLEVTYRKI